MPLRANKLLAFISPKSEVITPYNYTNYIRKNKYEPIRPNQQRYKGGDESP